MIRRMNLLLRGAELVNFGASFAVFDRYTSP
jgi:hypothetical protein